MDPRSHRGQYRRRPGPALRWRCRQQGLRSIRTGSGGLSCSKPSVA